MAVVGLSVAKSPLFDTQFEVLAFVCVLFHAVAVLVVETAVAAVVRVVVGGFLDAAGYCDVAGVDHLKNLCNRKLLEV